MAVERPSWAEYQAARRRATNSAEARRNRARTLAPNPLFCALCGKRIDKRLPRNDPWSAVVDHITEVTAGGSPISLDNMQPAHRWCNEQKERERRAALDGRTARPLPAPAGLSDTADWIAGEDP